MLACDIAKTLTPQQPLRLSPCTLPCNTVYIIESYLPHKADVDAQATVLATAV